MIETEEDERMVERLRIGIRKMFGKELNDEEIELNYLQFTHEELKDKAIPEDVLVVLANPIATTAYGYRDKKSGDFYEVCHLYYVGLNPHEVWFKNDDIIMNPLDQPKYI